MRPRSWVMALGFVAGAGSCDFGAAFQRYCTDNPQCNADGGTGDGNSGQGGLDGGNGPPILPIVNCGSSAPCPGPNQVCHPFGQVCMTVCNTAADCPRYLDTCVEIKDPSGNARTPKVCTCTSAQVCNSYSAGFTCNPTDSLCERLCASSPDCSVFQPARICDQLSGLCLSATPSCSSNSDCQSASQPHCDSVTLRCTGCVTDSDCASRPDGLVKCGSGGSCVAS